MQYSWPKVILAVWLISSAFMIYGLARIDDIVNRELYSFGLTFSHAWADSYWIFFRTTVLCVSLPAALSVGVFLRDIWKRFASKKQRSFQPTSLHTPATCPSCKKRFSNTLTMYDYSTGKAELIKICPFCNTVLKDEHTRTEQRVSTSKPTKQVGNTVVT
jgi:hypothetical protein